MRDCRIPCWSANKCSSSWRDCRCEQMFGERLFGGGYGSRYDTRYEQMFGIFCPYFARVVSGTSKVGQGEARGARGARQGEGERQGERARRERQGKARRGEARARQGKARGQGEAGLSRVRKPPALRVILGIPLTPTYPQPYPQPVYNYPLLTPCPPLTYPQPYPPTYPQPYPFIHRLIHSLTPLTLTP